jgi:hypothetical protein
MTPNIIKKRIMIIAMERMLGVAYNRARTATFRPSFLLIILRDRNILKVFTNLKVSTSEVRHR